MSSDLLAVSVVTSFSRPFVLRNQKTVGLAHGPKVTMRERGP
jgi:hypothetical protein